MASEVDNNQSFDKVLVTSPGTVIDQGEQSAMRALVGDRQGIANASQQLVESKIIPDLGITGGPADARMPQPVAPKDWTVAIDLAMTMPPHAGMKDGAGAERELPQLEALAKETQGKSVNILVHAERLVDADGKPCLQSDMDKTAACDNAALDREGGKDKTKAVTERYFIHDGKIEQLPNATYAATSLDTEALLEEAGQLAPSKNIGLIINAHGSAGDGIYTNLGQVNLESETAAIQNGLAGSKHQKLDLLDFNACDMAESKVLNETSQIANDVVASSGVEWSGGGFDGQNMPDELRALLKNSHMSGRQLGETIVDQAKAGSNGAVDKSGTPTLANFDLSKYDAFNVNVNRFGSALSNLADNDKNMQVIQEDIEKTSRPDNGASDAEANNRDLKSFAESILNDSKNHKFDGDTRALEDAASGLLKSYDPLVTDKFGQVNLGYDKLSGLSTYLPGSEILDGDKVTQSMSPLHQASSELKFDLTNGFHLKDKQVILDRFNKNLWQIPDDTEKAFPAQTLKIVQAQEALKNSNSDDSLKGAVKDLLTAVDDANDGPMGKKILGDLSREAYYVQQDDLARGPDKLGPDWDAFIRKVQDKAN